MTYQELVAKVKSVFEKADAHEMKEHVAVQINVEGEAEGIFYLEAADGSVKVEPYDYRDRDLLVVTSAATLTDIAEGRITGAEAAESGRLRAEGNFEKAGLLRVIDTQKVETPADEGKEAAEEPSASKSEEAKDEPAASESTEAAEEEQFVTESTEKAEEPPKEELPNEDHTADEPASSESEETKDKPAASESTEVAEEEKPVTESTKQATPADESKETAEQSPKVSQQEKTPAGRQMSRKQRKKWKKKKNC